MPSRYWNLNCGQSVEPGKGWLTKDDGVHVEFRGHDDLFKVFEEKRINTKNDQIIYIRDYLKHLIQIFNAAKNRMKLLKYIHEWLKDNYDNNYIVDLYIRFLKSGVVNQEILRQKLLAMNGYNNALGATFIHSPLPDDEWELLTIPFNKVSDQNNMIITQDELTNPLFRQILVNARGQVWAENMLPCFSQVLQYAGSNPLYGTYTEGPKDLMRMFALPNPNNIGPPFSTNTFCGKVRFPKLDDDTIGTINGILIYNILLRTAKYLGYSEDWHKQQMTFLEQERITTVYRFVYMVWTENFFGMDKKIFEVIEKVLNGLTITSDVHHW